MDSWDQREPAPPPTALLGVIGLFDLLVAAWLLHLGVAVAAVVAAALAVAMVVVASLRPWLTRRFRRPRLWMPPRRAGGPLGE